MKQLVAYFFPPKRREGEGFTKNDRGDLQWLLRKVLNMSRQLDHLRASVAAMTSAQASAEALLIGIASRLRDASNNDDMDAVDSLAGEIEQRTDELSAAVAENTTPEEVPVDPTPTPTGDADANVGPPTPTE